MSVESRWGQFFKPEVRQQGAGLVAKRRVLLAQSTDTMIRSYVKISSPIQVVFSSDSIESSTFIVDCSCPASGKGQFCKHIWATLLVVEEKYPDFLDCKTDIEKVANLKSVSKASVKAPNASGSGKEKRPPTPAQLEAQEAQKKRHSEIRKQQYQLAKERQKEFLKNQKLEKKKRKAESAASARPRYSSQYSPQYSWPYSSEVEAALKFFSENGFPLDVPVDEAVLRKAKTILSRVFHPDKGGSHEEILTLNRNFDILLGLRQ